MAFDPDAYLASKQPAQAAGGFDPDLYLKSKMAATPAKPRGLLAQTIGEENVRSVLGALPTAGSIVGGIGGGIAGTAVAPGAGTAAGSVLGAGAGQGVGEGLRQAGEAYFLGDEKDLGAAAKDVTGAVGEGALYQAAGGAVTKAAGKGLGLVAKTKAGQAVVEGGKNVLAKTGAALTGVPEKVLKTYSKYADKVKDIGKRAEGDMQLAADEIRSGFMKNLQNTRKILNDQLEVGLEQNAQKTIKLEPVVEALNSAKNKINKNYYPEQIAEIDDLIQKITTEAAETGNLPLKAAYETKKFLQEAAKGAYLKSGQIFQRGAKAQQAAKQGAAVLRKAINKEAPDIAKVNNQQTLLHEVENKINKNLIGEGKPVAALSGAGTGGNVKSARELQKLGELTGTDMLGEAEKFAAAQYMYNPAVLPMYPTGKATTAMLSAGGLGFLTGGPVGSAVSAALTSPIAAKGLIDAGRLAAKGGRMAAPVVVPATQQAIGRGLLRRD